MPIYAYRCASCGHAQDVLQKMSDPVLTVCPACGASAYAKQLTAAGFQLKGSGWYVTDFRGDSGAKKDKDAAAPADKPAGDKPAAAPAAAAQPAEGGAQAKASAAPAPATPAAPPPPAPAASR
jgi:putative FmdB family regulatory protein